MSRIGNAPVVLPANVEVQLSPSEISVKGPLGTLKQALSGQVKLEKVENQLQVKVINDSAASNAMSGTVRAIVANMVQGVTKGYERKLEIVGVGYRAAVQGKKLVVSAGYSHQVEMVPPDGVTFAVDGNTTVLVSGPDKELVGNEAAKVRAIRPPEPYKGKGIKYEGERILRKAGKTGKK